MARHNVVLGTATIPNGQSDSNWLSVPKAVFAHVINFLIYGPAALTAAVTVEVAANEQPVGGDQRTLQLVPGTDVTVPALKAVKVEAGGIMSIRVHSAGAEGAQRDFIITAQMDMA